MRKFRLPFGETGAALPQLDTYMLVIMITTLEVVFGIALDGGLLTPACRVCTRPLVYEHALH